VNLFIKELPEYAPWFPSCITERPIPAIPKPIRPHIIKLYHPGKIFKTITTNGMVNKQNINAVLKSIPVLWFFDILFSLKYLLTLFLRVFTNSGF
jgi:hypothetical protein